MAPFYALRALDRGDVARKDAAMTAPAVRWLDLPAGRFRALEWPGSEPTAVFLHGLTGIAEVWGPVVARLGEGAPRCIAIDQRGHGHSPKPPSGYAAADFAADVVAAVAELGLDRPHLVGHSMGGRVAIVAAARYPGRFRSAAIIDIGPEAWAANWRESVEAFERLPASWPDAESAIGRAGRGRGGESLDAALASDAELRDVAVARLGELPGGGVAWLADIEALKQTVRIHRSRDYWRDWERIAIPALLVRGGESRELRPRVAEEMRRRNPGVLYEELAGVGHNVPLLAPGRLAETLAAWWRSAGPGRS
ncbi:MAG: alpha/beta hydrolase [Dehalococcoidia bacterium]|nr:alpha/beta hydrolase [Dehalococcoidia bacterium]